MLGLEKRINNFLNYMHSMRDFSKSFKTKAESELSGDDLIIMVGKKKDDAELSTEDKADDTKVAEHFTFEPLKDSDGKYHVAENESEGITVGKEVTGDKDGMFKVTTWEQLNKKDPECPTAQATPEAEKPQGEDKPEGEKKDPEELPDGTKKDH